MKRFVKTIVLQHDQAAHNLGIGKSGNLSNISDYYKNRSNSILTGNSDNRLLPLGNNTELRATQNHQITQNSIKNASMQATRDLQPYSDEHEQFPKNERVERFRLQNAAHRLVWNLWNRNKMPVNRDENGRKIPNRFTACMKVVAPHEDYAVVQYDPDKDRARYGKLIHCSNPSCPVCASMIAEKHRVVLDAAIKAAYQQGYFIGFFTYTLRHTRDASLEDSIDKLNTAQQRLRRNGSYKRLCKKYGILIGVWGFEPTRTEENGWHPHRHEIVLLERELTPDEMERLEYEIWRLWYMELEKVGTDCTREHGFNAKFGDEAAARLAEYVAKYGKLPSDDNPDFQNENRHGLAAEATLHHTKKSRSRHGRTPMQLLTDYADGDRRAGKFWQEYFVAVKGKHFLHGLKAFCDFLGIDKALLMEEAEEAMKDELRGYQDVLWLTQHELTGLVMRGERVTFLEHVEAVQGDPDASLSFLPIDDLTGPDEPPSRLVGLTVSEVDHFAATGESPSRLAAGECDKLPSQVAPVESLVQVGLFDLSPPEPQSIRHWEL